MEGNPDKPSMIKVLEHPSYQEIQEEVTESHDQYDQVMDIENEADENIEIEGEEITGVNELNETEAADELGRGRRRKTRNRQYYNEQTINTLIKSEVKERNEEENIMALVTEYILTQYNLKH